MPSVILLHDLLSDKNFESFYFYLKELNFTEVITKPLLSSSNMNLRNYVRSILQNIVWLEKDLEQKLLIIGKLV
jgi:hypothetical protein